MTQGPIFDVITNESSAREAQADRAERCECGLASNIGPVAVYNEEAFRHFLEIERKRSRSSDRPFLLVLVDLKGQSGVEGISGRLFDALSLGLRETDFIGWYREGKVVGAVLTEHTSTAGANVADVVVARVTQLLTATIPHTLADRLQLRVYQIPPALQDVRE